MIAVRYSGMQDDFLLLGNYGCHFLVLCSIAEEFNNEQVDVLTALQLARNTHLIDDTCFVLDNCKLLEKLTHKKWTMRTVRALPVVIADNEYTELVFHNKRTGCKHYRRRAVDTLRNSLTVKEGYILEYRIYTATDK